MSSRRAAADRFVHVDVLKLGVTANADDAQAAYIFEGLRQSCLVVKCAYDVGVPGAMNSAEAHITAVQKLHRFEPIDDATVDLVIVQLVNTVAGIGRDLRSHCHMSGWRSLVGEASGNDSRWNRNAGWGSNNGGEG